ncbi:hypothetical protein CsSME_00005930 [Camellia sinensis var. sinensis]
MDQWETNDFSQPLDSNHVPTTTSVHCTLLHPLPNSLPEPRDGPELFGALGSYANFSNWTFYA